MGGEPYKPNEAALNIAAQVIPHTQYVKDFWIDKYEVTNAMYAEFLNATGYSVEGTRNLKYYLSHWVDGRIPRGAENQPVRWVSYGDANAYARWSDKRLPTNEEWEKAARGTDGRTYPWGNKWNEALFNRVTYFKTTKQYLVDADSYPAGASPYGVLNMEGNAGEWTSTSGRSTHPRTWSTFYVKRTTILGPGSRSLSAPTNRYATFGFRCARDTKPE